jgi:ribosomal protein S18 acetylase RimI-like enzyme
MIVRCVASLAELRAAWVLVAEILHQDETHPRNFAFYAEQFRRYPELLLIAHDDSVRAAPPGGPTVPEAPDPKTSPFAGILVGALLAHAAAAYVYIGKLAVGREQRGRGVGSALLREVERAARATGLPRLVLGADPAAVPFYLKHGYRPGILLQQTGMGGMDGVRAAVQTHLPDRATAWSAAENGVSVLLVHVDAVEPALLSQLRTALPEGTVQHVYTKQV